MKIVDVFVEVEDGCIQADGEYSLFITGFVGEGLDINSCGGVDDATLIKEACDNYLLDTNNHQLKDGIANLRLEESGEWEDVFWHKYYVVKKAEFHER